MEYNKKEFGLELKEQILKGSDCFKISKWAFEIYLTPANDFEKDLDSIVLQLVAMAEGPEFEYKNKQLSLLADLLIDGVEDPLKIVNNYND